MSERATQLAHAVIDELSGPLHRPEFDHLLDLASVILVIAALPDSACERAAEPVAWAWACVRASGIIIFYNVDEGAVREYCDGYANVHPSFEGQRPFTVRPLVFGD